MCYIFLCMIIIVINMVFIYNNKEYDVVVIKKNNKNTYVRVRDGKVVVTTSYFSSNRSIVRLLEENKNSIGKMISKYENRVIEKENFYFLGVKYQVIYQNIKDVYIDEEHKIIYVNDKDRLEKYLRKCAKEIYSKHLMDMYHMFKERIPFPSLRIRKMTSRWGVCNTKSYVVTLNLELMHYRLECLDYVIVHELAHLIEPNHSKNFWNIVSKYCPHYKELRKELR